MELFLQILTYIMFLLGIVAIGWYLFFYIKLIRDIIVNKEDGLLLIIMTSLGALAILIANLISAAINGATGVFWVYVVIGAIISIVSVVSNIRTIKCKAS